MGRILLMFVLLGCWVGIVVRAKQYCGDGFTRRLPRGNCYKVSLQRESWIQARSVCRRQGAWLVSVKGESVGNWVSDFYIRYRPRACNDWYWIGANDIARDHRWVWDEDGSSLVYDNWNWGEPNNWYNDEDAAVAYTANNKWYDVGHVDNYHKNCFVCEMSPLTC